MLVRPDADGVLRIPQETAPLQIWGGAEYTCNRVGDRYFDQMELSGHANRHDDMEKIASLGIRTLRCGLLWERHERQPDWAWSDARLHTMRQHGIAPIAGLVHHGSGPAHTSLIDPKFPQKLAAYAGVVAERYPWIDAYTPVNEPHTTARFSGMYGLWYPHHRSRESYLRALLNQIKATVLSMRAIRKVNSAARLIQTDDIGSISGTEPLRAEWELLNERQWLPFDLLCGRVDRTHPLFGYVMREGVREHELFWFQENPCPPDVIGVNYYLTSDRWIDHRTHLYPTCCASSEGPFVDVESLRVQGAPPVHLGSRLQQAWQRYGIPLAVTEVHLGGGVDEQVRWMAEAWQHITLARRTGVNCLAMTVWALFGSYYWNELVTRSNGHYEPGVFDVRGGAPVATELASFLVGLAQGRIPQHPALTRGAWWKDMERICFPAIGTEELAA